MKTDDLIRALSADHASVVPLPRTLRDWFLPALFASVATVWFVLGFRIDLMNSLTHPLPAARYVLATTLAVISLHQALALARPEAHVRVWPHAVFLLVALGLYAWAYGATPIETRQMAIAGKTVNLCLISIPLLAILPVAAIFATLRRGATRTPYLSSALAGLAGGATAAAVYALHCTEDSPLFYLTWYGLAIVKVTLACLLFGPRLLRW